MSETDRRAIRVLMVTSPYYTQISEELEAGALAALNAAGAVVERVEVPGALEIPTAIAMAEEAGGGYDGYVALGCVIRGETTHYEIVSNESARGLMTLGVADGLAIGNGVLTVEDEGQALRRAKRDELNKGGGAAEACLSMIALRRRFEGEADA